MGFWQLRQHRCAVNAITAQNETTNKTTQESNPDNRYWKVQITFKAESYASSELRLTGSGT